jgi:hypothetical protein
MTMACLAPSVSGTKDLRAALSIKQASKAMKKILLVARDRRERYESITKGELMMSVASSLFSRCLPVTKRETSDPDLILYLLEIRRPEAVTLPRMNEAGEKRRGQSQTIPVSKSAWTLPSSTVRFL